MQAVSKEAEETYQVCLKQPGVSPEDCARDKDVNLRFQEDLLAPGGANAYQTFVGGGNLVTGVTLFALCALPPLLLYPIVRWILAVFALFKNSSR
ncbi:MAG: hypothetical protein JO097_17515 [Acidobacteriaceae bacterium]|nr:hypothetical protein [Acidobacteriaceae bacterium]MBV9296990.1 hypothetical protein [Acidobacteriaceae bacterium]MBV9765608.1 hypothetical protein [Acidobacteriaceae bacterium]